MSSLNITNSAREIFRCPNCKQYISSNTCPKCSFQLTDDVKSKLAREHDEEVKQENRKFYKPFIYGGIGGLALGLAMMGLKIASQEDFSARGFGFAVVGLVSIFYGLRGLYKER